MNGEPVVSGLTGQEFLDVLNNPELKVKHQAEAWCKIVAMLIVDYGLDHTEPGEVLFDQVTNFLKRRINPNQ